MMLRSTLLAVGFSAVVGFTGCANTLAARRAGLVRRNNWIKDAFNSPNEVGDIAADRETPFDRWMGLTVKSDIEARSEEADASQGVSADSFVDSMEASSYHVDRVTKPMGIVFEENEPQIGGVFVASVTEGGAAAAGGVINPGDQLVAVGATNVRGFDFDAALDAIRNSPAEKVPLLVFRGESQYLYGRLGPSDSWLSEFLEKTAFSE